MDSDSAAPGLRAAASWSPDEIRRGRLAFALAAVAAFVLLLGLGLGMTFFSDEWAFLESRSLTDPGTWWAPHNEHWATLPIILYRAMVETIGIGSYVPYLAVVVGLHVVVAALVHLLLERTSGPLVALAGSSVVLVFGSGFENLYWGFQTGFVGSLALGLGAMLVTDRGPSPGRAATAAGLLTASLAASGIGLIVSVAVGVEWLLDRRWRRWVPLLAVPAVVYSGWFVAIGRSGVATFRDPVGAEALGDVLPSVLRGLGNSFGSISGLPELGLAVAAVVGVWGARTFVRGRPLPRVMAMVAAIVVLYGLIGAARGGLFDGAINYTRYTYVGGILALVAVGAMLGPYRLPARGRPRLVAVAALGSWLALAGVLNVGLLLHGREIFLARADMTRALITVALGPIPDGVDPQRTLVLVPSPASLERIVAAHGDPLSDRFAPLTVRPIPAPVLEEAVRRLRFGAPIPRPEG